MSLPGVLNANDGLWTACLIGIAFGFVLERAGLGNGRKLVGQFYGTDLTVFKVMMTTICTAMLGIFWLSRLGFADLTEVHIAPTYILPQTVGGVIFGAGFVMGGYCPGTSCVAAVSGKLDGLALMGGLLAGIVLFNEAYPILEGCYNATPLGAVTLDKLFGVSGNIVMGVVVTVAVGVFVIVGRVERRRTSPGRIP